MVFHWLVSKSQDAAADVVCFNFMYVGDDHDSGTDMAEEFGYTRHDY